MPFHFLLYDFLLLADYYSITLYEKKMQDIFTAYFEMTLSRSEYLSASSALDIAHCYFISSAGMIEFIGRFGFLELYWFTERFIFAHYISQAGPARRIISEYHFRRKVVSRSRAELVSLSIWVLLFDISRHVTASRSFSRLLSRRCASIKFYLGMIRDFHSQVSSLLGHIHISCRFHRALHFSI